jgi:hypothetical protein
LAYIGLILQLIIIHAAEPVNDTALIAKDKDSGLSPKRPGKQRSCAYTFKKSEGSPPPVKPLLSTATTAVANRALNEDDLAVVSKAEAEVRDENGSGKADSETSFDSLFDFCDDSFS